MAEAWLVCVGFVVVTSGRCVARRECESERSDSDVAQLCSKIASAHWKLNDSRRISHELLDSLRTNFEQ
jgi:hypothetical protein